LPAEIADASRQNIGDGGITERINPIVHASYPVRSEVGGLGICAAN
jgi:hypothetical protein